MRSRGSKQGARDGQYAVQAPHATPYAFVRAECSHCRKPYRSVVLVGAHCVIRVHVIPSAAGPFRSVATTFHSGESTVRAVFSTAAYWAEMSAAAPTSRRLFRRSAPPMGQMCTFIAVVVTVTVRKEGSSPPRRQQASSQLQESEQECASLRAQASGASTRIVSCHLARVGYGQDGAACSVHGPCSATAACTLPAAAADKASAPPSWPAEQPGACPTDAYIPLHLLPVNGQQQSPQQAVNLASGLEQQLAALAAASWLTPAEAPHQPRAAARVVQGCLVA